ncbi:hypothetical protein WJX84_005705 [Apatococcus fuscideae]|uniref:C3H1-type domain-containing protein n=1 Tax=Apatococcus fuscideae TaxID=2026836 RepID=A0AAW1T5H2_9CHLO
MAPKAANKQAKAEKAKASAAKAKDKKKADEERAKELNELFAVAIKQPKVPVGVDPKSMLCEYHKAGQCTKGFKCKFSHDLNIGRKTAKMDIYSDRREHDEGMEDWDQEELEKAVAEKHAAEKGPQKTDIICKFFIDAVEKKLYGWFWQCPNGKECKYRHALPPGFVLKSQMKELLDAEKENQQDIVDVIDEERSKVKATTQITETVFGNGMTSDRKTGGRLRKTKSPSRRRKGQLTGREIFMEEGFAVEDDMGATDEYERENDDENEFRRARDAAVQEQERMHALNQADADSKAGPSSSSPEAGPSSSSHQNGVAPVVGMSKEDQQVFLDQSSDDDDVEEDDLDDEELDALESSIKHQT